jgi:hypothetical protein
LYFRGTHNKRLVPNMASTERGSSSSYINLREEPHIAHGIEGADLYVVLANAWRNAGISIHQSFESNMKSNNLPDLKSDVQLSVPAYRGCFTLTFRDFPAEIKPRFNSRLEFTEALIRITEFKRAFTHICRFHHEMQSSAMLEVSKGESIIRDLNALQLVEVGGATDDRSEALRSRLSEIQSRTVTRGARCERPCGC